MQKPIKIGVATQSSLNPRLDYDGFPLHLNRLKAAVAYACTVIGNNYKQSKGKK